jgi:hypothetical protein
LKDNAVFMASSQYIDFLKCPFCLNHSVDAKSGKPTCPECSAEFEVDDRLECVFADTQNLRLPVNGFVCGVCGLVQDDENTNCVYCGAELSTTTH